MTSGRVCHYFPDIHMYSLPQCDCKDPKHKAVSCGKPSYKGDGYCDDENNNADCAYDGGDCCGTDVDKSYCTKVKLPPHNNRHC